MMESRISVYAQKSLCGFHFPLTQGLSAKPLYFFDKENTLTWSEVLSKRARNAFLNIEN